MRTGIVLSFLESFVRKIKANSLAFFNCGSLITQIRIGFLEIGMNRVKTRSVQGEGGEGKSQICLVFFKAIFVFQFILILFSNANSNPCRFYFLSLGVSKHSSGAFKILIVNKRRQINQRDGNYENLVCGSRTGYQNPRFINQFAYLICTYEGERESRFLSEEKKTQIKMMMMMMITFRC